MPSRIGHMSRWLGIGRACNTIHARPLDWRCSIMGFNAVWILQINSNLLTQRPPKEKKKCKQPHQIRMRWKQQTSSTGTSRSQSSTYSNPSSKQYQPPSTKLNWRATASLSQSNYSSTSTIYIIHRSIHPSIRKTRLWNPKATRGDGRIRLENFSKT